MRVSKADESSPPQLSFDCTVEGADDKIFFAFTYPYTYSMVQADLASMDTHTNNFSDPEAIYWQRELVSYTRDNRRLDLVTISSCEGAHQGAREPMLGGIFPESTAASRPPTFPNKDIIFVSARVHPGEVPAQWTLKGMLSMLLDKTDLIAREIRRRYVIKVVPMLNPDGVYRGHFRMDQFGQNLNRYYLDPDPVLQGPIFAAKKLIDHYAETNKLAMYIDLHAHASKRGCFIYGNVMDSLEDQVQNMLFCRLVAMNTPHFDYEGCLFSREHMTRIDPGDAGKGLTAEGSSRVATYLSHGLVHSYTLECNYNTSKVGNEVPPTEGDPGGQHHTSTATFCSYPEKFSPSSYAGVGRACLVALLDLRGQNPHCRIFRSKYKTVDRVRQAVLGEVRQRKEYKGQAEEAARQRGFSGTRRILQPSRGASPAEGETANKLEWKRTVNSAPEPSCPSLSSTSCVPALPSNSTNGAGAGTGAGHLAAHQSRQAYPITYQDFLPPGTPGAVTNGGQVDGHITSLGPGEGHTSSSARKVMTRLEIGTGTGTGTGTGAPGSRSPTGSGGGSPGAGRSPRTVSLGVGDAPDRLTPPLPSSFGGFGVRRGAGAAAGVQFGTGSDTAPVDPQPRPPRPSNSGSGSASNYALAGGARASNSSKSNSSRHGSVLNRLGRPGMAKLLLEATRAAAAAAVIGGAAQVPTEGGVDGSSVRSLADQIHSHSDSGGQGNSTSLGLSLHSHSTHTRYGHGSRSSKDTIVVAAPLSQRQVGGVRGMGRAGKGTGPGAGTGAGAGAGDGTPCLMVGTVPNPKQGPSFLSARSVGGQGASYALLNKVALSHQQVMLPLPMPTPVPKNGAVLREGPLSPIVMDRKR